MPISQQRMLDLISAAADYQSALNKAKDLVAKAQADITLGHTTPTESLQLLSQFISPDMLLDNPIQSNTTIILEQRHFKANSKRNDINRQRAKRKRDAMRLQSTINESESDFQSDELFGGK